MPHEQAELDWKSILESAGPYPLEAFHFVREGLSYTVERVHDEHDGNDHELAGNSRHISGQELCLGLRDYAIERYGLLAPVVLRQWRITRTDDFGRMVFAMIDAGLMSKTPDDSIDDFRAVYDFDEAFHRETLVEHLGVN